MSKRKGLMPSRYLAKLYFSIVGFGFLVLFWHIVTWEPCGSDPACVSRGNWPAAVWFGCIFSSAALLIADSFSRGLFDD